MALGGTMTVHDGLLSGWVYLSGYVPRPRMGGNREVTSARAHPIVYSMYVPLTSCSLPAWL